MCGDACTSSVHRRLATRSAIAIAVVTDADAPLPDQVGGYQRTRFGGALKERYERYRPPPLSCKCY